ncbi:MAG: restriction endonuclease subunit S, partial [Synergistaceae bacterium]
EDIPNANIIKVPSVLVQSRGVIDVMYFEKPFTFKNEMWAYTHKEKATVKYLYYSLKNSIDYFRNSASGMGSLPQISLPVTEEFEIPLPPLPVQEEIVHILDNFTELTARKQQYECYRDSLLTFGDEVEWYPLRDVALEFGRGKSKHRPRNDSRLYGGKIPFIQTGDIRNAAHTIEQFTQTYSEFGLEQSKLWPKGTLCITIAANIAETAIIGFDSCFPDSIIGFVANPQKTSSSYVEYLLTSYKAKLQTKSTGSAQENINLATFENWLLPFPPLTEQQRIVDILDRFDTLCNDISNGLPAEIKARQQQYEYYRDKLLTFKNIAEKET